MGMVQDFQRLKTAASCSFSACPGHKNGMFFGCWRLCAHTKGEGGSGFFASKRKCWYFRWMLFLPQDILVL